MNLNEFTARYACTLHTDTETKENFIKLPIEDLCGLSYLHDALLHGIRMLTQVEDIYKKESENSIYWISKIMIASYPQTELEGITKWLENK